VNISTLQIDNFRNYQHAKLQFANGINFILGDNAQGKTSLLEAVYLCGVGKSARTSKDKEMIKIESKQSRVQVKLNSKRGKESVDIVLDRTANKRVSISGVPVVRLGELMGVCSVVLFSPDELRIVKEGPNERRRFMDIALCQLSKTYFYTLNNFNKVLSQRNKLLKNGRASDDELFIWDKQFVEIGAKIAKNRRGFVDRLASFAKVRHFALSDTREELTVKYHGVDSQDLDIVKQTLQSQLDADRVKDLKHGYTHSRPHKDDIQILLNGTDARCFGSQGQQRSAALSLKLAEIDILTDLNREPPILLLDDVLSELDNSRCKKLLQFCKFTQTLITATHIEQELLDSIEHFKKFVIKNGTVE
jgi:DNA replication and repair protein RecF